jgi:hypothetical protein
MDLRTWRRKTPGYWQSCNTGGFLLSLTGKCTSSGIPETHRRVQTGYLTGYMYVSWHYETLWRMKTAYADSKEHAQCIRHKVY